MSYTCQNAKAARRIADAPRAAGIEEWLDQSELRGARVLKFREQMRTCAIFVPIVSAPTQSRPEDYFRLECKLAAGRAQDTCS